MQNGLKKKRWLAFFMAVLMVVTTVNTEGLVLHAQTSQTVLEETAKQTGEETAEREPESSTMEEVTKQTQEEEAETEETAGQTQEEETEEAAEGTAGQTQEETETTAEETAGQTQEETEEAAEETTEPIGEEATESVVEEQTETAEEETLQPDEETEVLPAEGGTESQNTYTGRIETWGEDAVLLIASWDFNDWKNQEENQSDETIQSQTFGKDVIIQAIEAHTEATFDVVALQFEDIEADEENGTAAVIFDKTIDSDINNAAISILNVEYEGRRISYYFYDGLSGMEWSINQPKESTAGVSINVGDLAEVSLTADGVDNQGAKLKITKKEEAFADLVSTEGNIGFSYNNNDWEVRSGGTDEEPEFAIRENIFGGREIPLKIFPYVSGEIQLPKENWAFCNWEGFSIDCFKDLEAGDYLITRCEGNLDEENVSPIMVKIGEKKLMDDAPQNAAWKSLAESVAAVDSDGYVSAVSEGEAYIYAKYTVDSKECFKIYRVEGYEAYRGEVVEEDNGEVRLRIASYEMPDGGELTKEVIKEILEYRAEQTERFDVVEISQNIADSSAKAEIVGEHVNLAVGLLDPNRENIRIEYNFHDESINASTNWNLNHPFETDPENNIDVADLVTVSLAIPAAQAQGIKIKLNRPVTDFPAENVSVYLDRDEWMEKTEDGENIGIKTDIFGARNRSLKVFTFASGNITGMMSDCSGYAGDWGVTIDNVNYLTANKDYLVMSYEGDEGQEPITMKIGDVKDLKTLVNAPAVTVWKSLYPGIATVDNTGKVTAVSSGEAFIWAKYNQSAAVKNCIKVYRVEIEEPEITGISFDKENLTIKRHISDVSGNEITYEDGEEWLQIVVNPWNVHIDTEDQSVVRIESSDPEVAYPEIEEDGRWRGRIVGKKAGKATITATYLENETIKATCPVTVMDDVEIKEWPVVFAVTNFDTKLGDVKFPEPYDATAKKGWQWVDENISLKPYQGMSGHQFMATYTEGDWTEQYLVYVNLYTVSGVSIVALEPDTETPGQLNCTPIPEHMAVGDDGISLGYMLELSSVDNEWNWRDIEEELCSKDFCEGKYQNAYQKIFDDYYKKMNSEWNQVWSSNPADLGTTVESVDKPKEIAYQFAPAAGTKAGKKTITFSIKNKKNKVLMKDSVNITVTAERIVDYEDQRDFKWHDDGENLLFWVQKDLYETLGKSKLTVKSSDDSVLKLNLKKKTTEEVKEPAGEGEDAEEIEYVKITIPYTFKPGVAWLTLTAADEIKSSNMIRIEFIDHEPQMENTVFTINKALEDPAVVVTVMTREDTTLDVEDVTFADETSKNNFAVTSMGEAEVQDGKRIYRFKLSLKNSGLKNGKYSPVLNIPASWSNGDKDDSYTVKMTVSVTEKAPAVTLKQTVKVNTFYTKASGNGNGLLDVNTGGLEIESLRLTDCDLELQRIGQTDQYNIVPKENVTTVNDKKGTYSYKIKGYSKTYTKAVTISVVNSKPAIVLSAKTDTLYPNAGPGYWMSSLTLIYKATGEAVNISRAQVQGETRDLDLSGQTEKKLKYNTYKISFENSSAEDENGNEQSWKNILNFDLQGDDGIKYGKQDSITIKVWEEDWNEPVSVVYKITVNKAETPKLKFGSGTLTLNKNKEFYKYQQSETALRLNGCSNQLFDNTKVTFEGQNQKAKDAMNNGLTLEYRDDQGLIIAGFDRNKTAGDVAKIKNGTYNFKVYVVNRGQGREFQTSATLKIKIVDTAPESSIKISAKGSIDLLNREGTSIAYTPKVGNAAGKITDARLDSSLDGNLFSCYFDEQTGKLMVQANEWEVYSTKQTYKVKAVFSMQPENGAGYEIVSKTLSFKVKQGKPKITLSSGGNRIYRQIRNDLEINFKAVFDGKEIEIEDVWLLNYTDDLELRSEARVDDYGNEYYSCWNPDTNSVTLQIKDDAKQILKSGKTWELKFAVRYKDKAGNEKSAQVKYKVYIK